MKDYGIIQVCLVKKKKKKGYDKKNMRGIRMVNKRYTPRPGI